MIEQGLVYIHSAKPPGHFVGCGALVEGGYVATCRHVWEAAIKESDTGEEPSVDVEYPFSREDGSPPKRRARLVDDCLDSTKGNPDLVLLEPEAIPSDMMTLQVAAHERYEIGNAHGIVGVRRPPNPRIVRNVQVKGQLADRLGTDGRRQFTGNNSLGYWLERGSSGSPVFLDHGMQLAGIFSLAELGANDGASKLHEAFVIPGTTIRLHLERLVAKSRVKDEFIDPADLPKALDAIQTSDAPVSEIPRRIRQFVAAARMHAAEPSNEGPDIDAAIDAARAKLRAAEPVRESNEGADIDAAIGAARVKLSKLDTAGARSVLVDKIAEEEQARRLRLLPLLREKAVIERLAYDHTSAKATLSQLVTLAPDSIWDWIGLGDLNVTIGSLAEAAAAFRRASDAARRVGNERDRAVSHEKIGDVQVAQGDLAGALKSYRDDLAIMDRLTKSDAGNAVWQHHLSSAYDRIGNVQVAQGDHAGALKSYGDGLAIRDRLAKSDPGNAVWQRDLSVSFEKIGDVQVAQGELAGALKSYRDDLAIIDRLAKSDPGNTGWQRDLSVSYERIGDVQMAQGDLGGGLKSYRDDHAIVDRLAKSDPGNAGWQYDLGVCNERIGSVLAAQGDLVGALESYQAKLDIISRLAISDPGNADWQRDLSVSYSKLATVFRKSGETAKALDALAQGRDIMARMTELSPTNATWKRDLAWFDEQIAALKE
jgi:tetratricopeptide (TPR) repeat protein